MRTEIVKIYSLDDPDTGEVRYVGKTMRKLSSRLKSHIDDTQKNKKTSWIKQLSAKGKKPVISEIEVLENPSLSEWQEAERFWIETLRFCGCRLTNLCAGGQGPSNPAPESREKMSAWQRGRVFSEEHRRKMSIAATGRLLSEETKKKMSLVRKGRKFTELHRARLSISMTGRKPSPKELERLRTCNIGRRQPAEEIARRMATQKRNRDNKKKQANLNK